MMRNILFLFAMCISCLALPAQEDLWSKNYYEERTKSGVKKVIILERYGKGFDSLHIYTYDSLGRKTNAVRFAHKGSSNHSYMTLRFKDTLCTDWTAKYKYGDVENSIYKYSASGDLLSSRYYRMKLEDTILRQTAIYSYNARQQLIKLKNIDNGLQDWEVRYVYDKDRLIRKTTHPYKGRNSHQEELYFYNTSGVLDSTQTKTIQTKSKKILEFGTNKYENGRLIKTVSINFKGKTILTNYFYNSGQQIDSLSTIEDTIYTITKYTYVHGKLVSERTITNVSPIALDAYTAHKMKTVYPDKFVIEVQYIYDPKGNVTERTKIMNGEIIDQRKFIISYY